MKISINGMEITAQESITILEAAERAEICIFPPDMAESGNIDFRPLRRFKYGYGLLGSYFHSVYYDFHFFTPIRQINA